MLDPYEKYISYEFLNKQASELSKKINPISRFLNIWNTVTIYFVFILSNGINPMILYIYSLLCNPRAIVIN